MFYLLLFIGFLSFCNAAASSSVPALDLTPALNFSIDLTQLSDAQLEEIERQLSGIRTSRGLNTPSSSSQTDTPKTGRVYSESMTAEELINIASLPNTIVICSDFFPTPTNVAGIIGYQGLAITKLATNPLYDGLLGSPFSPPKSLSSSELFSVEVELPPDMPRRRATRVLIISPRSNSFYKTLEDALKDHLSEHYHPASGTAYVQEQIACVLSLYKEIQGQIAVIRGPDGTSMEDLHELKINRIKIDRTLNNMLREIFNLKEEIAIFRNGLLFLASNPSHPLELSDEQLGKIIRQQTRHTKRAALTPRILFQKVSPKPSPLRVISSEVPGDPDSESTGSDTMTKESPQIIHHDPLELIPIAPEKTAKRRNILSCCWGCPVD